MYTIKQPPIRNIEIKNRSNYNTNTVGIGIRVTGPAKAGKKLGSKIYEREYFELYTDTGKLFINIDDDIEINDAGLIFTSDDLYNKTKTDRTKLLCIIDKVSRIIDDLLNKSIEMEYNAENRSARYYYEGRRLNTERFTSYMELHNKMIKNKPVIKNIKQKRYGKL